MPLGTPRGHHTPVIECSGNAAEAGYPFGSQRVNDGAKVVGVVFRSRLDRPEARRIPLVGPLQGRCPVWVPELRPPRLILVSVQDEPNY